MLNLVSTRTQEIVIRGATFFYKIPSWSESKRVSEIFAGPKDEEDPFKNIKPLLKMYLTGWEGVGDEDEPIEFSPDLIDRLPYDVAFELALELNIINRSVAVKKKKGSRK